MVDQLYALPIPKNTQQQLRRRRRNQLSSQGKLESDVASVDQVTAEAGNRLLVGQFRGEFADMLADEVEELFAASSIEVVPFYDRDGQSTEDGYYAFQDVDTTAPVAGESNTRTRAKQFDGTLTRQGTNRSHYRAVKTNPQDVDNPFGSDSNEEIALSIRASEVRWYDNDGGSTESATVQRTISGQHDDLQIYDTTEPTFSQPWIIYNIDYSDEFATDMRVWDDHDRDKSVTLSSSSDTVGTATVGSATVGSESTVRPAWQRVFVTDHGFDGEALIESECLRLRFDEDQKRLVAYEWNDSDEHWDIMQLGTSSWRFDELDITDIGLARVEAQVKFRDTTSTSTHRLDLSVSRGAAEALCTVPTNGSSPPSGLTDRLDPIASTTDRDPVETGDIVERSEVRL